MIELTEQQVTDTIQKVVAEAGDGYVYEKPNRSKDYAGDCLYLWDNKPSCLVGHVLVELGFPKHVLRKFEGATFNDVMLHQGRMDMPTPCLIGLRAAQTEQDSQGTWGDALIKFKNTVAEQKEGNWEGWE